MNENTLNLVSAIINKDATDIESSFNAAMAEKIAVRLDDMHAVVAQSMFAESEETVMEEVEQVDEVVHVYRQDADRDRGPLASKHSAPYREVNQKSRDQLAKEVKSARKSGAFKVTSGKTFTQKTAGGLQGSKLHILGLKNTPKAAPTKEEVEQVDESE